MGIVEVAAALVTAIATSWYAIAKAKEHRRNTRPPIRVYGVEPAGDDWLIRLEIFPAKTETTIRRITSNAQGITLIDDIDARNGYFQNIRRKQHSKDILVDIHLLPDSLSTDSVDLFLSIKPRSNQSSFTIKLYRSFSRFTLPTKIIAM